MIWSSNSSPAPINFSDSRRRLLPRETDLRFSTRPRQHHPEWRSPCPHLPVAGPVLRNFVKDFLRLSHHSWLLSIMMVGLSPRRVSNQDKCIGIFFVGSFFCEKRFLYCLAAVSCSRMICVRSDSGWITSAAAPNPRIQEMIS